MRYRAFSILNHKVELFIEGLRAAGFEILDSITQPQKGDFVIAWNRKSTTEDTIQAFERVGGAAIIAENGFIGTDDQGRRLISIAFSQHSGLGKWHIGKENRYKNHNFEVKPWRESGGDIVILAQRNIGSTSVAHEWADELRERLRTVTKRPVRVRRHPGKDADAVPLEEDIRGAHAVITYSSAAGIKAIAAGIPCFHMLPGWIGQDASVLGVEDIEKPFLGSRRLMLHRVGWAQWTPEEVACGLPFVHLKDLYASGALLPTRRAE